MRKWAFFSVFFQFFVIIIHIFYDWCNFVMRGQVVVFLSTQKVEWWNKNFTKREEEQQRNIVFSFCHCSSSIYWEDDDGEDWRAPRAHFADPLLLPHASCLCSNCNWGQKMVVLLLQDNGLKWIVEQPTEHNNLTHGTIGNSNLIVGQYAIRAKRRTIIWD